VSRRHDWERERARPIAREVVTQESLQAERDRAVRSELLTSDQWACCYGPITKNERRQLDAQLLAAHRSKSRREQTR
jgi:hypothetical protein